MGTLLSVEIVLVEKFKAKAVFAYSAQNEGELSVEQGDIVQVLEKPDPQWWRARTSGGSIGMLPATYLEEYIEGQIPAVGTYPLSKGILVVILGIPVCIGKETETGTYYRGPVAPTMGGGLCDQGILIYW